VLMGFTIIKIERRLYELCTPFFRESEISRTTSKIKK